MLKIHYYSDCPFFAGCENMLVNFFNSKEFAEKYKMSFSYRYSFDYEKEFKNRVQSKISCYRVFFPHLSALFNLLENKSLFLKKILTLLSFLLLTYPVFIYEVIYLFFLFKKINPDVLHINNGGYPAALSARAAAVAGKIAGIPKILMIVNNMAVDYKHPLRWLDYPIDIVVKYSVDVFIMGSNVAKKRLHYVLKLPEDKLVSIHNGISLRSKTETSLETKMRLGLDNFEGVIFGIVALLIPRKGHEVLFNSILEITDQIKNKNDSSFKILVEGDGSLKKHLKKFVYENNLEDWIIFVGDENNIVNFMSILDVLILSSIKNEDFPNVILEAMGLGKAVISTRLAGTPEQVVDNVTGVLVEPDNIKELAEAICNLRDNHQLRLAMGIAGRNRFKQFFSESIALNNYMKIYQQKK